MEENLDNFVLRDWERSIGFSSEDPETVSMQGVEVPTDTSVGAYAEGVGRTWGEMLRGALAGTLGAGGDIESIFYGIKNLIDKEAGEGAADAFLAGMAQETMLPTTKEVSEAMPKIPGNEDQKAAGAIGEMLGPGGVVKAVKTAVTKGPKAVAATGGAASAAVAPTAEGKAGVYNNPGNVEATEGWAGDTGERYGENGRFAVFDSPEMGLRALMRDVRTKIKDSKGSIKQMITKYAPPNENPTDKYIAYVEKAVGKKKAALKDAPAITKAILEFENKPSVREHYLADPKIFETASKLSTKAFSAGTTFEQAKAKMGIK